MKNLIIVFFVLLAFSNSTRGQDNFKVKVDSAFSNSLKGVFYAMENIPERKNSANKELIADNKLIAQVKISKGIGGVYIQATGFYNSYKVTTEVYRDYKSLKTEGYIDYIPHEE